MFSPIRNLPPHCRQWIENYARKISNSKKNSLGAKDFNGSVKPQFPDGTFMLFGNAFYTLDAERKEITVFTEHCGYHVFPLSDDTRYSYSIYEENPDFPIINLT